MIRLSHLVRLCSSFLSQLTHIQAVLLAFSLALKEPSADYPPLGKSTKLTISEFDLSIQWLAIHCESRSERSVHRSPLPHPHIHLKKPLNTPSPSLLLICIRETHSISVTNPPSAIARSRRLAAMQTLQSRLVGITLFCCITILSDFNTCCRFPCRSAD